MLVHGAVDSGAGHSLQWDGATREADDGVVGFAAWLGRAGTSESFIA